MVPVEGMVADKTEKKNAKNVKEAMKEGTKSKVEKV
jgi:hypothetical protein